jgi:diguanylate cyclase (GGDEF)-like protein/PAS domain S-box-containing protein
MGTDPSPPSPATPDLDSLSWSTATFDQVNDFVAMIDLVGNVAFANRFTERLLGLSREDAIGSNIAEFVHPDDVERGLRVIGMMAADTMDVAATPAVYRIRRGDGSWCPVEINASSITTEQGQELVLILGRYSGDRNLQDRIMESLIGGGSPTETVGLIPAFGEWRHAEDHYVVFFADDHGHPLGVGSAVGCSLRTLGGDRSPWARAMATNTEIVAGLDDLPDDLRQATEAAGLTDCWAIPVMDPLHDHPAVIVGWRRVTVPDIEVHRYALETMARNLLLILQWRLQATSLRRAARRDPLTGVANRTGFWEVLESIGSRQDEPRVGVLYVDLDGFKGVNDQYGHRVGDQVLTIAAHRINAALRPGDSVARLGGDEFAVVCRNCVDDGDVVTIAGRLVAALQEPFALEGATVTISASIGVAVVDAAGLDPDELLDVADRALYHAKNAGRGRWHMAPTGV